MTTNRRFSSALQALTGLTTEERISASKPTVGAVPTLDQVLSRLGPLPAEALFLGVATDGLPVLLNLYDPHPGPMLIAGDAGSGKTAFLQTIAQVVAQTHDPKDVRFGVVTNYPEEWERVQGLPHQAGVFAVGQDNAQEFIRSLATWAHSNKNTHQCVLLLVDDLESVASLDPESVQSLRWLLLRGPSRRVWPLITLNAPRYGQVISWLQNFRTRVFGRVANARIAEALTNDPGSGLDQLEPRIQFSLREKDPRSSPVDNWLRFWLPSF